MTYQNKNQAVLDLIEWNGRFMYEFPVHNNMLTAPLLQIRKAREVARASAAGPAAAAPGPTPAPPPKDRFWRSKELARLAALQDASNRTQGPEMAMEM